MSWLPVQTLAQISIERVLNALPEGFLVALFAWALLRVLRRQNSGTRFAVWFLALLTVAALPVLGGFGEGRALMAAGMSSGSSWGSMRPAITIPARWALFVFLAWALGAGAAMVRLAAGLWRLRQMRRSCTPIVAADLDPAVRRTVAAIGTSGSVPSRSIMIATSECVRVPAAIGFWKRTIVLPAWALRELPPNDLNVILLHEFAHLRRWDEWTNLIQKIVRALFFFHPAVWWIENRLSVEREMACDDAVLAETANPHGYATCLVSLLEKSLAHRLAHKRRSMAQAAVDRAREASLRLARILDANRPVATRVWKPALGMAGAFSMVCLAVLPHAPQFVVFDRGMFASNSDHGYATTISQPSLQPLFQASAQTPAVIPAALRTGESSSVGTSARVVHARVRAHDVAGRQLAPARVVAVRLNAAPPRDRVVEASASADQEIVPQFRTLVFIEATEYRTSDLFLWSVHVWRVMLVNPDRDRLAGVPVANSI
ncbi:MAG TPA: M56 family metallopeptidase [Terriglobales bacterium]|nr:M56 family metallopeptidase [Terriglobales bacterium]